MYKSIGELFMPKVDTKSPSHYDGFLNYCDFLRKVLKGVPKKLLMTKYSNEVSFLDLVTILTTLYNLKCRRFLGHPLQWLQMECGTIPYMQTYSFYFVS